MSLYYTKLQLDLKDKDTLVKECYRDNGWGRGPCTKGWRLQKLNHGRFIVKFWEEDGNYAGGDTFNSGEVYFSTAYMIILGIEAFCKERQAEKPYG